MFFSGDDWRTRDANNYPVQPQEDSAAGYILHIDDIDFDEDDRMSLDIYCMLQYSMCV